MKKNHATKSLLMVTVMMIVLTMLLATSAAVAREGGSNIVEVDIQSSSITWTPLLDGIKGMTLTVTGPDGFYFREEYDANARPTISSGDLTDGTYNYEISLWSVISPEPVDESLRGLNISPSDPMTQSGAFTVLSGSFVSPTEEGGKDSNTVTEGEVIPNDVVNADDFIVQGSLCAGFDCINNEVFGFDTIRLKENNTRLSFDDTSVGVGFPANDWTIVANDSASGGANYLAFQDVTGAKFPFMVTAGAPTNSLFVSSTGNLGIGTGAPILDIHTVTGDTPAIRLEQNGSGGFTPQTWDVAGNEANFFVRDVTGGSRLPFRIRPGAPTSSIDINAAGNVGIGTSAPVYDLDVANTGAETSLSVRRTDGTTLKLFTTSGAGIFGTENDFPLQFQTNNIPQMTLATSGNVGIGTDAPAYDLDVANTAADASLGVRNTSGATAKLLATSSAGMVGTENNFPLQFQVNNVPQMTVTTTGRVGIGTSTPTFSLQVKKTGVNSSLGLQRTNGAILKLLAATNKGVIGTQNKFPLQFWVNNKSKMTLATDGTLTVLGRVKATAFNVTSDRNAKENFAPIDQASVLERLSAIPISTWNFIENDNKVAHMGPMAQDFYAAFGLGMDDKHISTTDADGVAFAAIQELNSRNEALSSENVSLHSQVDDLAARISSLESSGVPISTQPSQNGMILLNLALISINLGLIVALVWLIHRGSLLKIKSGNS